MLWHPPWTGEGYRRVDEVPALAAALQAPGARFVAQLLSPRPARLALALAAAITALALAQDLTSGRGVMADSPAAHAVQRLVSTGALGWEGALLDGRWWSCWTAHLLHWPRAPVVHALGNLPFLAYCGYRVERAWGWTGLLRVLGATVALSSTAILSLSEAPVLGSSMLAFGLLGAQIAIGFRMADHLPPGLRGRYGWGSLRAVLLLLVVHKGIEIALAGHAGLAQGVSHLGHASGLLGGALAVLWGSPAALRPVDQARGARRVDLALCGTGLALPALLGLALPLSPWLTGAPWRPAEVEGAGLRLSLPWRMEALPVRMGGLRGWRGDPGGEVALYVDRALLSSFEALDTYDWGGWWAERLAGAAEELAPPPALGPGWQARSWRVEGQPGWIVTEHQRRDGLYVTRAAWALPQGAPAEARERLYGAVLRSLQIDEPPDLVAQRERHARQPEAPARSFDLAHELYVSGRFVEADALLVGLLERQDGWQWDAARTRLRVFTVDPQTGAEVDPRWLLPLLEQAPAGDLALLEPGISWLATRGACQEAHAALTRWATLEGADAPRAVDSRTRAADAWSERCAP